MEIKKEVIINKPIAEAWQVLGVQFTEADKWSRVINHSAGQNNNTLNGSSCTERGCDISGMGKIKEKLLSFLPIEHKLSYQIFEGLPSMVKYAENNWGLSSLGNNKTRLEMILKAETQGVLGTIMRPMMKINFSKMGTGLVEDFKFYLENGEPSPAKLKAIKKFKK